MPLFYLEYFFSANRSKYVPILTNTRLDVLKVKSICKLEKTTFKWDYAVGVGCKTVLNFLLFSTGFFSFENSVFNKNNKTTMGNCQIFYAFFIDLHSW